MIINNLQKDEQSNRFFQGKLSTNVAPKENQKSGKSFFVGDLNVAKDSIAERREQAQKQAMKLVKDTFSSELEMDQSIEDSKKQAQDLRAEAKVVGEELAMIAETKEEMKEICGPEEYKKIEEEFKERENILQERKEDALNGALSINMSISSIELERLKSNPMVKTQNAADRIEKAASKEIIGMLKNEAIDTIDKIQEEVQEKQEKIKEEKEKEEEITQTKEKEEIVPDEVQDIPKMNEDIQKKLDEILESQKLLKSDLKGIMVDQQI